MIRHPGQEQLHRLTVNVVLADRRSQGKRWARLMGTDELEPFEGAATKAGLMGSGEAPKGARRDLEQAIADLLADGLRPLSLGGDHAISYPIVAAVARHRAAAAADDRSLDGLLADAADLAPARGFGDALRLGYQNRPHLFSRHSQPPEPPGRGRPHYRPHHRPPGTPRRGLR